MYYLKYIPQFFYAISDVEIRGRCVCNGHASRCIPDGNSGQMRCQCEHNTCGKHCDQCCPTFAAKPWARNDTCSCKCLKARTSDSFDCVAPLWISEKYNLEIWKNHDLFLILCFFLLIVCECTGHATECRFDERGRSVCIRCQGNTEGEHCERCKFGFYRSADMKPEDDCIPCSCGKEGSTGDCVRDSSYEGKVGFCRWFACYCFSIAWLYKLMYIYKYINMDKNSFIFFLLADSRSRVPDSFWFWSLFEYYRETRGVSTPCLLATWPPHVFSKLCIILSLLWRYLIPRKAFVKYFIL